MIRLTRSSIQPIGLDLGQDGIRMLQLEVTGNSLSVVAAARATFGAGVRTDPAARMTAAAGMIKQMLSQGFVGRRVVAAIPREAVHAKNVRLPGMPADEMQAAIKFEAQNLFPFDAESAKIDFIPLGEVRQGSNVLQEVIVIGVKNEDAESYVEQLNKCGVVIESLDVEPCSLYRCVDRFVRRREDETEVNVLVDVGYSGTRIIIGKGREISFFKQLDVGAMAMHEAVSRKLGITLDEAGALSRRLATASRAAREAGASDQQAEEQIDPVRRAVYDASRSVVDGLAREVALCLRYHSVTFRGHRAAKVRILGGAAYDAQLLEIFSAALPIATEPGRPLVSVDTSRMKPTDRRGTLSEWGVAMGLALKRTTGRFMPRDGTPRDTPPAPAPSNNPILVKEELAARTEADLATGSVSWAARPAVTEDSHAHPAPDRKTMEVTRA